MVRTKSSFLSLHLCTQWASTLGTFPATCPAPPRVGGIVQLSSSILRHTICGTYGWPAYALVSPSAQEKEWNLTLLRPCCLWPMSQPRHGSCPRHSVTLRVCTYTQDRKNWGNPTITYATPGRVCAPSLHQWQESRRPLRGKVLDRPHSGLCSKMSVGLFHPSPEGPPCALPAQLPLWTALANSCLGTTLSRACSHFPNNGSYLRNKPLWI